MIDKTEAQITQNWRGDPEQPVVTVKMLAYNHEKYIEEAIDSVLMQETDFPFEIVIHDDCSTDSTAAIIRRYEEKFPTIVRPIYRTENHYSKRDGTIPVLIDQMTRGTYIALCEGDDFWTDPTKLQRQCDVLRSHPDYPICFHSVDQRYASDMKTEYAVVPSTKSRLSKEGVVTLQLYLDYRGYPFQTSCYMFRNDLYRDYLYNKPDFAKCINIGDRPLCMYLLTKGNGYFIERTMSCYRRFAPGSWSAKTHNKTDKKTTYLKSLITMMERFSEYVGPSVDCHLVDYRFRYHLRCENFRELCKPEYRSCLKRRSFAQRAYVRVCGALPFVSKIIRPRFHNR